MPFRSLASSPLHEEYGPRHPPAGAAVALPKVGVTAAAAAVAVKSGNAEAFKSFLDLRPISELVPRTSFKEVVIKFLPRDPAPDTTEMECEDDLAICNRQCEKLYGENEAEMEEPCKLAVAQDFANRGLCFPSSAEVQERSRGTIHVADVKVGDELAVGHGEIARVIALLHNDAELTDVYLQIQYQKADGSVASLTISPAHLVHARMNRRNSFKSPQRYRVQSAISGTWSWIAAQEVRPGDELENDQGEPVNVQAVTRTCLVGAFAPLTTSGQLLVDGVLCSCYAPPWALSHQLCHISMLPVRCLDLARRLVENMTHTKDARDPWLTVEAVWILPTLSDTSLHPWASGLLRSAYVVESMAQSCKELVDAVPIACRRVHLDPDL